MACEPWPIAWACDPPADVDLATAAAQAAQAVMWAALGRRHGVCTSAGPVPVRRFAWCGCTVGPALIDGVWHNVCTDGCDHADCCWLPLPLGPVRSVESVTVYGAGLAAEDWRLEGDRLVRVGACWPRVEECDPSPVVVGWTFGLDPPAGIAAALGEMACEMVKGWTTGACRLPSRLTSITRQGIAMDLGADLAVLLDHGLTGLPVCDALIRAVNPAGLTMASAVLSPDFPGTRPFDYRPTPA